MVAAAANAEDGRHDYPFLQGIKACNERPVQACPIVKNVP